MPNPPDKSPPEVNSKAYWEERFQGSWDAKRGPEQTRYHAALLFEHLPEWFIQDVRRSALSICDWGCAEGEAVVYFSQMFPGSQVAGVDFAEQAIANARRKFPRQSFEAADWLAPEAAPAHYGVVLASHVLEHFADALHILREVLARAAQSYIVMLVPYAESPERPDPEHRFRFVKTNLPLEWGDWQCAFFKVVAPPAHSPWGHEQALVIYARAPWLRENKISLSLADFPAESGVLAARLQDLEKQKLAVEQRLETQLLHDRLLMNTQTVLRKENTLLAEAGRKLAERLDGLETEHSRLGMLLAEVKQAAGQMPEDRGNESFARLLQDLEQRASELGPPVEEIRGIFNELGELQELLAAEAADTSQRLGDLRAQLERLLPSNASGDEAPKDDPEGAPRE